MLQQLILHIGSDKAGSSAIQVHVYGNRRYLLNHGIFVPRSFLTEDGGHGRAFSPYCVENLLVLANEINQHVLTSDTALLSWEGLHLLDANSIRELRDHFSAASVRIIYYVRDQAETIQSGILQQVKEGYRKIALPFEFPKDFRYINRDYAENLRRWQENWPGLDIEVVYYDRSAFPDGNVVRDFFSRLGIDTTGLEYRQDEINRSFDVPSTLALQSMSEMPFWSGARRQTLVEYLLLQAKLNGYGEQYFLDQEQVAALRKRYQECNQKLVAEYGVSEKLLTHFTPVARDSIRYPDALLREQAALIERRCRELAKIPVFDGEPVSEHTDIATFLGSGWATGPDGAIWNDGDASEIRFRFRMMGMTPFVVAIRVELELAEYSARKGRLVIALNEMDQGFADMSRRAAFIFPIGSLPQDNVVTIRLKSLKKRWWWPFRAKPLVWTVRYLSAQTLYQEDLADAVG